MTDLKDIPLEQSSGGKLPEDKLMAYLEGTLSPEEQHEVELWLAEEGMESDALEGLKELPPEETKRAAAKLNYQLRKSIAEKRKVRRPIKDNPWALMAVVIILLLVILAFMIIRMSVKTR